MDNQPLLWDHGAGWFTACLAARRGSNVRSSQSPSVTQRWCVGAHGLQSCRCHLDLNPHFPNNKAFPIPLTPALARCFKAMFIQSNLPSCPNTDSLPDFLFSFFSGLLFLPSLPFLLGSLFFPFVFFPVCSVWVFFSPQKKK